MDTITISVMRPEHGMQLMSIKKRKLQQFPVMKIFPDNKLPHESAFPADGVSIISKPQGHLVIAHQHHEKWVLSDFTCEIVDLDTFSQHWKGCRIVVFNNTDIS